MKPFFVYMLRCSDNSFYVGHTDDLDRRMAQHHAGLMPGYTSIRRPLTLVWSAEMPTRAEALDWELRLKRWTRVKKAALARGDWESLHHFSRSNESGTRGR
ncbi:MAG: hypothetical protein RL199_241 [Pseudomonadota bacterium]|jgi:tRNA/rRNA methyltransferase